MVPIGRGQRELIIGDRQTGKTAVPSTRSSTRRAGSLLYLCRHRPERPRPLKNVVRKLEETARWNTPSSSPRPRRIGRDAVHRTVRRLHDGEYFRDRGMDALIVYDDLTKQAWAYRQISLLRRPPGREALPRRRVLSALASARARRASTPTTSKFTNGEVKGKTGSLTALPVIETQAGDVSAFVPTNVISITDGQIFLETDLFNAGIRPAINAGISVSRVGGAARPRSSRSSARRCPSGAGPVSRTGGVRAVRFRPGRSDPQAAGARPLVTELMKQPSTRR